MRVMNKYKTLWSSILPTDKAKYFKEKLSLQ